MQTKFWISSWDKYIRFLFLTFGAGLFCSGAITWIAANWAFFSKFEKLFATQSLIIFFIAASLYFIQRKQAKSKIILIWFIASVLIGGLFALIGQIYQTGADPWQLFALWAALQLPLWLVLPNVAGALLWIVTANLALGLYCGASFFIEKNILYILLIFNAILLALSEWRAARFDPWRIVPRALIFICALLLSALQIWELIDNRFNPLLFLLSLGALGFYRRYRFDMFALVVLFCSLVLHIDIWLLTQVQEVGQHLAFLFTLAALIFALWQINTWMKQKYPQLANSLWVALLYLFLVQLSLGFALVIFDIHSFGYEIYLVLGAVFYGLALYFHRRTNHYVAILFILGISYIFAYGVMGQYVDYEFNPLLIWRVVALLAIALCLLAYGLFPKRWFRVLMLCYIGGVLYLLQHQWEFITWLYPYYSRGLLPLSLLLFYLAPNRALDFSSAAWAALIISLAHYVYFFLLVFSYHPEAATLPEIHNFVEFFQLINQQQFSQLQWDWKSLYYLALLFAPLATFFRLNKKFGTNKNLLALIAIALFSLAFSGSPWILAFFALLFLAYSNQSRHLWIVSVALIIVFLTEYYYWLAIPLLYKSLLLLASGLVLLLTAIALYKKSPKTHRTFTANYGRKPLMIAALLSLIATLGIANVVIVQNEEVINHGRPILLKLAPVDPRSLMQGDYMELNYDLVSQARTEWKDGHSATKGYALLTLDEQNIATLCRLEYERPQHFEDCTAEVYLPVKRGKYWDIKLPSHQYFFAEGRGEHFAQAQYGEYRFKEGKALLVRLLDKDLKPL